MTYQNTIPFSAGNPYLLIGYCPADEDRVAPVLAAIEQSESLRFYADVSVDQALKDPYADVLLLFLSEAAMADHTLRQTLNQVLSSEENPRKKLLLVYLEEFPMTPVQQQLLTGIPALDAEEYANVEALHRALKDLSLLKECLNEKTIYTPRSHQPSSTVNFRYTITRKRTGTVMEIEKGNFTIGRSDQNTFSIPDNMTVSKRHAIIEMTAAGCSIRNAGSPNGVYVNDLLVEPGTEKYLTDEDLIELGSEKFVFHAERIDFSRD